VYLLKLRDVKILHEEHVTLSAAHVRRTSERGTGGEREWERRREKQ
jgi:hypothetical protein